MLAALCVGFMFLFRKSEYLTAKNGIPKSSMGVTSTLLAENTHFWFNDVPYAACATSFPLQDRPSMMSMFLPISKGDPLGKGATRFFPADPSNSDCLVQIAFNYVISARLQPKNTLFGGCRYLVSSEIVSQLIKVIDIGNGLPHHRFSPHSLRVGGLVTLMAADVPDHLKQLAGRWANPKSFVAYARATLHQFNKISSTLNDKNLVTADEIKKLYIKILIN